MQAMPSARPRAPSPSARVAFTLTGAPSADVSRSAIWAMKGARRGCSATTVQSALTGDHPAWRASSTIRDRISRLSAPAHLGSVSGA